MPPHSSGTSPTQRSQSSDRALEKANKSRMKQHPSKNELFLALPFRMPALPCVLLQRSAQELPSCLGRSHSVTRTSLSKAHKSSLQTEDGKHQSCPGAAHVTANPLVRKEDVGPCGGDRALLKQEPPARAQPFPISYGAPSNRGAFPPAARCDTPHPGRSNLASTVLHKEGSAHLHYCAPMSAPMTQNIPPPPKTSGGPLTLCPPPVHMTYSLTSKSILPPPTPFSSLYTYYPD